MFASTQHALRSHLCARTRRTAPELPAAVPGLLAAPRFRQHPHSCAPHPRTPRTPLAAVIACSSVQRARRPRLRTRSHTFFACPVQPYARAVPSPVYHIHSVLVFAQIAHARSDTNPHVLVPTRLAVPSISALTPDYVWPPPLRPLVFAQISHARSHTIPHVLDPTRPAVRAHSRLRTTTSTPSSRLRTDLTRKAPRHTTATRTELTIPITRPLHYTSRPPLFPCLSTRGAIRLARLSSRIPGKMCRTLTRNRALAASGVHLRGKVAPRLNSTAGQSTKLQCWHLLLI